MKKRGPIALAAAMLCLPLIFGAAQTARAEETDGADDAGTGFWDDFLSSGKEALDSMKEGMESISSGLGELLDAVGEQAGSIADTLVDNASAALKDFKGVLGDVMDRAKDFADSLGLDGASDGGMDGFLHSIGDELGLGDEQQTPDFGPLTDGIRPAFKEAMDSYEAFFDEYIEFMADIDTSNDSAQAVSDYADLLTRYEETMKAIEDIEDIEMSEAEEDYYIETLFRIETKMLNAVE